MPYVIVSIGGQEVDRRPVADVMVIGRASDAQIRVHDSSMSRRHCIIEPLGTQWFARDLGSKNGTSLNGRNIHSEKLEHGDMLRIGRTKIQFLVTKFEAAPPRAKRQSERPEEPGGADGHHGLSDTSLDLSSTRLPLPQPKAPK